MTTTTDPVARSRERRDARRSYDPTKAVLFTTDGDAFGGPLDVGHYDVTCPEARTMSPLMVGPDAQSRTVPCPVCVIGDQPHTSVPFGQDEVDNADPIRTGGNHDGGPGKPIETIVAETEAWLRSLDRKVVPAEVTFDRHKAAKWYLARYDGTFDFMLDLRSKGGARSVGQAKGVLNVWRADLNRSTDTGSTTDGFGGSPKQEAFIRSLFAERRDGDVDQFLATLTDRRSASAAIDTLLAEPKRPDGGGSTDTASDDDDIPDGRYAVQPDNGSAMAFYRVDRPTEGRWAGRVFVNQIVGGQSDRGTPVRGAAARRVFEQIREQGGPAEASKRYGHEIGACGVCGRTLTNDESREAGIGPVCAGKQGW